MITIIQQKQIWQARFSERVLCEVALQGDQKFLGQMKLASTKKGTTQTLLLLARQELRTLGDDEEIRDIRVFCAKLTVMS